MGKEDLPNLRLASLDIHSPLYLKSARSEYSGGDIGDMYPLVDVAAKTGFKLIELTPIQDTGLNSCPYLGTSIFSYNPIHLDVEQLHQSKTIQKLKEKEIARTHKRTSKLVDYRGLYKFKINVLKIAFKESKQSHHIKFDAFDHQTLAYATFTAIKNEFNTDWALWPNYCKKADIQKILATHPGIHQEVKFNLFVQSILEKQWLDLKAYAASKNIHFIIDKPIYPVHNSAEVWANQEIFYLKPDGSLQFVSGCKNPNDPFGEQVWGHAVYKFKEQPQKVVDYYIEAIRHLAKFSNWIRFDHILALVWKYYIINPENHQGVHHAALRDKLFLRIMKEFPNIRFTADDVGIISKQLIDKPLEKYGILGTRCPQWCIHRRYLQIAQYPKTCIATTAIHDTESLLDWWRKLKRKERKKFERQVGAETSNQEMSWSILSLLFQSKAQIASVTLRDLSHDLRRYNKPGSIKVQNWKTRMELPLESIDWTQISSVIQTTNRA